MGQVISIGKQDYVSLREKPLIFTLIKTDFIRQWWKNADDITLIRRGDFKTLNMSMHAELFFKTVCRRERPF